MSDESADWGGPYLQAALLCEQVIEGKDGVLTLVRVIDRVTQTAAGPEPPRTMPQVPINLKLVLMFKSGVARGSHSVRVKPIGPTMQPLPELSLPVLFEGDDDRGANLVLNLMTQLDQEGLYWFNVLLGDRLLTRIPLRIVYQRLTFGM